jgi:nicotinate-nucleotide adenylyltransferase
MALADAALAVCDEVLFVLPRTLPHKEYDRAGPEDRLEMLLAATASGPRFSVGVSEGGLFIEIARECREIYPDQTRLYFLCGRDAAERIINWDYGHPEAVPRMLDEFELLVARRGGLYVPPEALRERIHPLPVGTEWEECSATEVRNRIAAGEPWQHLVPREVVELAARIYAR